MRTYPRRVGQIPFTNRRFITPASDEFGWKAMLGNDIAALSAPWFSVNDPVAMPFTLNRPLTIYQLGWVNGTSVGEGVDIGVYDEAFTRIVSIGGVTAAGTASGWEFNNIADTVLGVGRYYLACARDNVTANRVAYYQTVSLVNALVLFGVQDSATNAYPLPNPLTNMALAATAARFPCIGMCAYA